MKALVRPLALLAALFAAACTSTAPATPAVPAAPAPAASAAVPAAPAAPPAVAATASLDAVPAPVARNADASAVPVEHAVAVKVEEAVKAAEPEKPAESDDDHLQRLTGEMMSKVEEMRGLKFKQEVKRVWKSREEAKDEMLAEIDKQGQKQDLESESKALVFFGLMKEGQDLKSVFADFIASAAGGYYMPETKTFSLVRGFDEDANRPIVFHELIHAVEDQYFDYQARSERYDAEGRSDQNGALHAVVEGSARTFENRFVASVPGLRAKYMKAQMKESMKQMAAVMRAPPALVISVAMFPYENGSRFLAKVLPELEKGSGGKTLTEGEAFAAIYADPPTSTEQILHPEKYLGARDLPREIRMPDATGALGGGWKQILTEGMGELATGLLLNAGLKPNIIPVQIPEVAAPDGSVLFKGETAEAVSGWDGDRYVLFESGELHCAAWLSVWDSPEDAGQFAALYGKVVGRRYGTTEEKRNEAGKTVKVLVALPSADFRTGGFAGTRWKGTRDGDSAVLVEGDRVLVLERVPADRLEALAAVLEKSEVVQDPKDAVPAQGK